AEHCQGDSLRCIFWLPLLSDPFLEPADGFILGHPAFHNVADGAEAADASLALFAWFSRVRVVGGEQTDLYSGPSLCAWRVVLFSRAVPFEIAVDVSAAARGRNHNGFPGEAAGCDSR